MAYTNSSLVSYTKLSPNKTSPRNHIIDCITIHCVVGQCSVESLGNIFASSSRQASSNYGVGYDGRIGLYVEEKNRSWCTDSRSNDHRAITIEVASDTTHPYAVKDKALAALIELVADICKRNNIKKLVWSTNKSDRVNHVNGCNMTVHRDYANKSCPGQYLYDRHGYIAEEVNKRLGVNTSVTPSVTPPATNNTPSRDYLMRGDKGQDVKVMQENLIKLGYSCGATGADGDFGNNTEIALKNFQKKNGLVADGKYGKQSKSKAESLLKQASSTTSTKIDTVKEVQNWANTNYKSGLVVDGIYGANTKKALVKILQTELNQTYNAKLIVDGIWGNKTRAACPTLRKGARNDVVNVLQALLVCNGYSNAYVDGNYGSGTYDAVRSYQSKKGLAVDGIAGQNTFAKLCC